MKNKTFKFKLCLAVTSSILFGILNFQAMMHGRDLIQNEKEATFPQNKHIGKPVINAFSVTDSIAQPIYQKCSAQKLEVPNPSNF